MKLTIVEDAGGKAKPVEAASVDLPDDAGPEDASRALTDLVSAYKKSKGY